MIEGAEHRQRTLIGFPGASHVLSKLPFRTTPRCPVVLHPSLTSTFIHKLKLPFQEKVLTG